MNRTLIAAALFTAAAYGQPAQPFTASIRGGGGDRGKCTIEVNVDGVAEVEIRGDRGLLRTLSGQPATWTRFECNQAPPRNPANFRFRGIDGRGRQTLIRDPQSTNGVAVVRLEDPQGGREGYTFDIEWDGGAGYGNSPWDGRGGNNRPNGNWGGGNDRGPGNGPWNNGRNNSRFDVARTVNNCEDMVRARARRDFGARDVRFRDTNSEDLRNNRDRVWGQIEVNRGERYDFTCSVNMSNGDVRNVDLRRSR